MPVYRDDDGKIVDDPTQKISAGAPADPRRQSHPQVAGGSDETVKIGGFGRADAPASNAPSSVGGSEASAQPAEDEPKTKLFRATRPRPAEPTVEPSVGGMADPVVGWLAIIAGPGKGNSVSLGYGLNTIGRGEGNRVVLDFGDAELSRVNHAAVTYDPRNRLFFVSHGGGVNLTYIGSEPDLKAVLAPTELEPLAQITLGKTVLRFVPLCSKAFDWQDLSNEE